MAIYDRVLDSVLGEKVVQLYLVGRYKITSYLVPVKVDSANITLLARNKAQVSRINRIYKEEKPVIEHLLSTVESTDIVWDVGADFGFYSSLLSDVIPGSRVYAFEPYHPRVARLRLNLRHNKAKCPVVTTALGNRDASLDGYTDVFNRTSPSVATGDQLVSDRKVGSPDVIKIDVDGGEYDVLDGLRETLQSEVSRVYVEVHPQNLLSFGRQPEDVREVLGDMGFDIGKLHERPGDGDIHYLLATK